MRWSKSFYEVVSSEPSTTLMANVEAKICSYSVDDTLVVATVVDHIKPDNGYVVSPYTMMITYSKDELVKVKSWFVKKTANFLITVFALLLRSVAIDRNQGLNNYMLSTNFFDQRWETMSLDELEKQALKAYPDHALWIRSVNRVQNLKLFEKLTGLGWLPLVSRQVYLFNPKNDFRQHQDSKRDLRLLDDSRYCFFKPQSDEDYRHAQRLYELLYLQKYSIHNVHYQAVYMKKLCEANLLHLRLLYDHKVEAFVAVVGLMGEDGVMTVPIVGYETLRDQNEALYRRVMIYAIKYAYDHGCLLNLSSGAPEFKKYRGAKAELEYMFVKVSHLSWYRRWSWRLLSMIANHFYGPILQRYKL